MTPKTKWTLAICGLLTFNVGAMTALALAANNGGTQIIPAYDVKAAHYSDELARTDASRKLGWLAQVTLRNGQLEVSLVDAQGQALTAAQVRVAGYQRAHAASTFDLALTEAAPGIYRAAIAAHAGWHDLVLTADRAGTAFTQRVAIEAP